jgi:hypothetical protein
MASPNDPLADNEDLEANESSDVLTRGGSVNDKTGRDGGEQPGLPDGPSPATTNDRTGR